MSRSWTGLWVTALHVPLLMTGAAISAQTPATTPRPSAAAMRPATPPISATPAPSTTGAAPTPPANPSAPAAPASDEITVRGRELADMTPLSGPKEFISPMGEPFRSETDLAGAELWFRKADANGDGRMTREEFRGDAMRFFNSLDTDHDKVIGPIELEHYENDVAPEIRVMNTFGDPSKVKVDSDGNVTDAPYPTRLGAGRYSYIAAPEPVLSTDSNLDRGVTVYEFITAADARMKSLDHNGDGVLTRDDLPHLRRPNDPRQ